MKHNYCVACGIREQLHQHHLVPKSRGGSNDETNLITLCTNCHDKIHGVNNSLIKLSAITREKMKKEGKRICCHAAYGKMFADDKKTIIDNPNEQKIIEKVCELRTSLNRGSITISRELAKLGYVSRNGKPFCGLQVNRILASCGIKPWQNHNKKQQAKSTQTIGQTYEIF